MTPRLMRRLAHYLRPVLAAGRPLVCRHHRGAASQLAQPYLMKVAIDRYIATGQLAPLDRLAAVYFVILVVGVCGRLPPDVDDAADRAEIDVRHTNGAVCPLAAPRPKDYDRNPVGRLMTRVTSDVDVLMILHVRRCDRLRRRVHAGTEIVASRQSEEDMGGCGRRFRREPCSCAGFRFCLEKWRPLLVPRGGSVNRVAIGRFV